MKITQSLIPKNSLAEKSFPRIDYQDAYDCVFKVNRKVEVADLVLAFFNAPPKSVRLLMNLRNLLVKLVGLKAPDAAAIQEQRKTFIVELGKAIGLFKVVAVAPNEVLMGEDDRHLDFRISFLLEWDEKMLHNYSFTLSTTVFINNWLGRLYFFPVQVFHKRIVPLLMKKMIAQLHCAPSHVPSR